MATQRRHLSRILVAACIGANGVAWSVTAQPLSELATTGYPEAGAGATLTPVPTPIPADAEWVPMSEVAARKAARRASPSPAPTEEVGSPVREKQLGLFEETVTNRFSGPTPTAAPTPTPLVTPPTPTPYDEAALPPLPKATERLRWEASLAENSHQVAKSEITRLALLVAYERALGPVCMPELHRTLTYAGAPTDPRCLELLDKTLQIDPHNPLVSCARDGIDAPSCRAGFGSQKIEFFSPSSISGAPSTALGLGEQLDAKLSDTTIEPKLREIEATITTTEYKLFARQTIPPEQREVLRKNYEEALGLACRITRLAVADAPSSQAGLTTSPPPVRTTPPPLVLFPQVGQTPRAQSPMAALLDELGGPPTPAAPLALGKIRKRLISTRCRSFVDRAIRFDPLMALPVCYRDGFYTPACIDARRAEQRAPRPTAPAGETGRRGLPAEPTPRSSEGSFTTF